MNDAIIDGGTNTSAILYRTDTTLARLYGGSANLDLNVGDNRDWKIYRFLANGGSSELAANGGAPSVGNMGSTNLGGITLFTRGTMASYFSNSQIAEVLAYSGDVSDVNQAKLWNYLNGRWAVY